MTVKEIQKSVEKMKKLSKKIASSKEKSREFMIEAGIYTPTGQLAKPYR